MVALNPFIINIHISVNYYPVYIKFCFLFKKAIILLHKVLEIN